LEGRDQKDGSSRPGLAKSSQDPISTNGRVDGACLSCQLHRKIQIGGWWSRPAGDWDRVLLDPTSKITTTKRAGKMTQVPSKHETLSSKSSTTQKKRLEDSFNIIIKTLINLLFFCELDTVMVYPIFTIR
jgi:hypothetical protein